MPITGMLSSRFGRKHFFIANVVLFTLGSMACGLSRSLDAIIVWRVVQGIGGGVLITVSQAILRETFPVEEQGMAMGIYGMGIVLAPAFGPTLGGWITDQYSWPWVFFINVPIGVLNILLVLRFIEDPPYLVRTRGRIDWFGVGTMTLGLGALQLMLAEGQKDDWFSSRFIVTLAVLSVVGIVAFIWRELVAKAPAVDLRLFRNISFTSATAIGAILGLGLYAALFLLPLFLQNLLDYTATESGLVLMPRGLAMAVLMPLAGRLYNRIGPKILVMTGLVVSAYSFWALSHLTTEVGFWDLFWPQMWQGVGFGLIFVALSTAALSAVDRTEATAASGLYNVVRRLAGSVGVALSATALTGDTRRYRSDLVQHVTAGSPTARHWLQLVTGAMRAAGAGTVAATKQAYALLNATIERQASVLAYNHVFLLVTGLFVVSIPLVFLVRSRTATEAVDVIGE